MSASEYKALANAILVFYPPDKLTPLSPISVLSPLGSVLKSDSN